MKNKNKTLILLYKALIILEMSILIKNKTLRNFFLELNNFEFGFCAYFGFPNTEIIDLLKKNKIGNNDLAYWYPINREKIEGIEERIQTLKRTINYIKKKNERNIY